MDQIVRGHLVRHALVLVAAFVATSVFFVAYEGTSWGTAVYYVSMIVTLVGSNYQPTTTLGLTVSILLAFVSVGILLSLVGQVFGPQLVSTLRSRARMTRITHRSDHLIIVGTSDTSWALAQDKRRASLLIVGSLEDFETAERRGIDALRGDATHAKVLQEAGIAKCSMVLATSDDDAVNAFVTLKAKHLRPDLRVLARISHEDNRENLIAAGADEVICPATLAATEFLRETGPPA